MERLLGELDGKMELVLQKLDKINGTIAKHSEWIAAHEQAHKSMGNAWGKAWQMFTLILAPVLGGLAGLFFGRER